MIKEEVTLTKKLTKIKNDLRANGIRVEAYVIHYYDYYETEIHPEYEIKFISVNDESEQAYVSVYDSVFCIKPCEHIIYWTPSALQVIVKFINCFYKSIAKLKIYKIRYKNSKIKKLDRDRIKNCKDAVKKSIAWYTPLLSKNKCKINGNNNTITNIHCTDNKGIICGTYKGDVDITIKNKKEN